ncbi:DUF1642 domain-containing protein [Levilactobacillus brevis]|nr:DUF1642 domain-containing protein [Levilactobacillus brevis]
MIKTYRKTATIKAERFDDSEEMVHRYELGHRRDNEKPWLDQTTIWTLEGEMQVIKGDWLVSGVNGEHWPIADDVFKKSYAELPVIPKYVTDAIRVWKQRYTGLEQILGQAYQLETMRSQGSEVINWIMAGNVELFARAWLDGYQVKEAE